MTIFTNSNRSPILQALAGTVTNVGASQVAVVKVPPGATYASLTLRCGIGGQLTPVGAGTAPTLANLKAFLTQFRLLVGGVEMWTLTGNQLISIMEYYMPGLIGATGILTISFQRLWMKNPTDMLGPDYGTYKQSSFQLEITQDATSTITNIDAFAEVEPVAEQLGAHIEYKRISPSFAGTGLFVFPDLFKDPGSIMFALWLNTSATITNLALVGDGTYIWDAPVDYGNALGRQGNPIQTPQATMVPMNFCRRGLGSDAVPLNMATLQLRMTFSSAPNTFDIIQECGIVTPDVQ